MSEPTKLSDLVGIWKDDEPFVREEQDVIDLRKQRDAWRDACRYMYSLMQKQYSDLDGDNLLHFLHFGDLGRLMAMVGKAECLDEKFNPTDQQPINRSDNE